MYIDFLSESSLLCSRSDSSIGDTLPLFSRVNLFCVSSSNSKVKFTQDFMNFTPNNVSDLSFYHFATPHFLTTHLDFIHPSQTPPPPPHLKELHPFTPLKTFFFIQPHHPLTVCQPHLHTPISDSFALSISLHQPNHVIQRFSCSFSRQ